MANLIFDLPEPNFVSFGCKDNFSCFSDAMKEHWDGRKPVKQNLDEMGLAYDPNKVSNIAQPDEI